MRQAGEPPNFGVQTMRWHVRCGKSACRKRHSLLKHPDEYARGWKCRGCGGSRYTVVKDRNKDRGQVDCYCGAYVWPSSTGRYECLIHRRGSPSCHFNANGTPRVPDVFGRPTYSCPHDGIPRWPALYCSEATRPAYSRWHFGWKATQAAGSSCDTVLGEPQGDMCDVPGSEAAIEIVG